jgi:hypothetical protein
MAGRCIVADRFHGLELDLEAVFHRAVAQPLVDV